MRRAAPTALVLLFFALAPGCAAVEANAHRRSNTAIERTLKILKELLTKGEEDKLAEELTWTKYRQWWESAKALLEAAIEENRLEKARLEGEISALQAEIDELVRKIGLKQGEIDILLGDKRDAYYQWKEHDSIEYARREAEYADALDKIERAMEILKEEPKKVKQAEMLLVQLATHPRLTEKAKVTFTAFLSMVSSANDNAAPVDAPPEAYGYENQSHDIIRMLENLRDQFRTDLHNLVKERMDAEHAFNMLIQSIKDQLETLEREIEEFKAEKNRKVEKQAALQKTLNEVTAELAKDEEALATGQRIYDEKLAAYNSNMAVRNDELDALRTCVEVLEGEVVADGKQHFKLALRQNKALAQFMAKNRIHHSIRHQVMDFLQSKAGALKSKHLQLLVEKMEGDPFAKVKGLINEMIQKLEDEADADKTLHEWCEREEATNRIQRADLTTKIEGLDADIENLASVIYGLEESINQTNLEIEELNAQKAAELERWALAKAAQEKALQEATDAHELVQNASQQLKDFYDRQGLLNPPTIDETPEIIPGTNETFLVPGANASSSPFLVTNGTFLVQKHKRQPAYEGTAYVGNTRGATVVALMEVITNDFDSLKARLADELAADTKAHDEMIAAIDTSVSLKTNDVNSKTAELTEKQREHDELVEERATAKGQLELLDEAYKHIVSECEPKGMTYAEQLAKREEELESLKQALALLNQGSVRDDLENVGA